MLNKALVRTLTMVAVFILSACHAHTAHQNDIVVIKTPEAFQSKQKLPYFHGISAESAGSKVLSMNMVVIPPGAQAEAHYHDGYESAIYVIQGQVETRYGDNLEK